MFLTMQRLAIGSGYWKGFLSKQRAFSTNRSKNFWLVLCSTAACFAVSSAVTSHTVNEELAALQQGMETYAALHGMNLTTYDVTTSDGWLLGVHRLQSMKIFDKMLSTPVLLCHGFGAASFDYVNNRRNESLGFLSADSGYDVWMINFRANRFSNRKVDRDGNTERPSEDDYIRVSFQYMADRDIPAVIDKILEITRQEKLFIVGYSMGGTSAFAFLSEHHEYDDKILHFAALAPVVRVGDDCATGLRALFNIAPAIPNILFAKSRNRLRRSMMPSGLTLMTAYHFSQEYARQSWTKLDYRYIPQSGIRNFEEYGREDPPVYDFNDIRVNYSVFFTTNDMFTGVETAKRVIDDLDIAPKNYKFVEDLTHLDVVWGWDSRCWVYDDLLDRFNKIEMTRGEQRVKYRQRAADYVNSLNLVNSCDRIINPYG